MAKSDKNEPESTPEQTAPQVFVHEETGDQVTGTMEQFNNTLEGEGYILVDTAGAGTSNVDVTEGLDETDEADA